MNIIAKNNCYNNNNTDTYKNNNSNDVRINKIIIKKTRPAIAPSAPTSSELRLAV